MSRALRAIGRALWVAAGAVLVASGAAAASNSPTNAPSESPIQILPGTSSREPISIDADKLVYYDKEHKAVYSGNVVVIQGDTKMTCSVMTVFLDRSPNPVANPPLSQQEGPSANSGVKRLEAIGPVTVISKTQVATSDNASYDKGENKVFMIGHVTLSDGENVTKGDKLTYDLKSGQATIDASSRVGRVHGQFIPNGGADANKPAEAAKPK